MTAGAWTFTSAGRTSILDGTFDIDSDTWKMALFLSTSNIGAASTTYAGVTNEVANGVGYTTGGIAITLTLAGTTTVTGNVLLYSLLDTAPADVTAPDGETFTVAGSPSGIFVLS